MPTHHLHTHTQQHADGTWTVDLLLNGAPCGRLGPVADERTADWLAEGVGEGLNLAMQRAIAEKKNGGAR